MFGTESAQHRSQAADINCCGLPLADSRVRAGRRSMVVRTYISRAAVEMHMVASGVSLRCDHDDSIQAVIKLLAL